MNIEFNYIFHRWEVFSDQAVIRANEKQPCFVSAEYEECEAYIARMEAAK